MATTGKVERDPTWMDNGPSRGTIPSAPGRTGCLLNNRFAEGGSYYWEEGQGHAAGPDLSGLQFQSIILGRAQGEWDSWLTVSAGVVKRVGEGIVNLYGGRGPSGNYLGVAHSADLVHWQPEKANPVVPKPKWADAFSGSATDWKHTSAPMKDPDLLHHDGVWYLYYITRDEG